MPKVQPIRHCWIDVLAPVGLEHLTGEPHVLGHGVGSWTRKSTRKGQRTVYAARDLHCNSQVIAS